MFSELRQKAVVQAGGVVAIQSPELSAGTEVQVIILVESRPLAKQHHPSRSLLGLLKAILQALKPSIYSFAKNAKHGTPERSARRSHLFSKSGESLHRQCDRDYLTNRDFVGMSCNNYST